MMMNQLPQTWDLDAIFEGGSRSPALAEHLEALHALLGSLQERAQALGDSTTEEGRDQWVAFLADYQASDKKLWQAASYIGCLNAQDVNDQQAKVLEGRIHQFFAASTTIVNQLDARILAVPEPAWAALLADPRLSEIRFPLEERRQLAADKMPVALENLATDLSVDGYHAWSSLYDRLVARVTVPLTENGETVNLSVGQAYNKFHHPDRAFRQQLFTSWEEAWAEKADLIGAVLNNLAGFRLNLYRQRGWNSVLKEPLDLNRMTEGTLWAMWEAVWTAKSKLTEYHRRKARLLGFETLNWYDLSAPLAKTSRKIPYEEAAAFIVEQFDRFSPRLSNFAQRAFENAWIEVEDRPGKAPGGFCISFPESCHSRIFMTYGGDVGGVGTLAHELGHAYHSDVMFDLAPMVQNYSMNVAETASTFAELITTSAAIKHAPSVEERLALLDDKIQGAVAYLMNIHARFIFENRFYEERRRGPVAVERLNELMETAQKEAYADSLGQYHPGFWASKGHFYGTGMPFYNFPYTFGYLFSAGIFVRAMEEGPTFDAKYVDLLRDTGRSTVEDLARRHLGVDLTKPDFWLTGVQLALADVDEFLRLTENRA